jgi:hypothetical protein
MIANAAGASLDANQPAAPREPPRRRRHWRVVAMLLAAAIFAQAVFAGLMLSGVEWARAAHAANAIALIGAAFAAGLLALVTLRRVVHGVRLGVLLLLLAAVIALETAVGKSAAEGANLMWLHIPLGVALLALATQSLTQARRLDDG